MYEVVAKDVKHKRHVEERPGLILLFLLNFDLHLQPTSNSQFRAENSTFSA